LLYAQFVILRQWALLVIAAGYLFSAFMVVGHALSYPGAFSQHGFLVEGTGIQAGVWLYVFWHAGLIVSFIGYALLKDKARVKDSASVRFFISVSIAIVSASTVGLYVLAAKFDYVLPIIYADIRPISTFRHVVGAFSLLTAGIIAMVLLWTRKRSILDLWLLVALFAFCLEVLTVAALTHRNDLGWYAGRFYQLVTAMVVMVVLLAEMNRLYAGLAYSNITLQNERARLEQAIQAQRREREARLGTGDTIAAAIAHEVKQPLSAIITRAGSTVRWLEGSVPDIERVKNALRQIASDGFRAGAVIDSVRANFKRETQNKTQFDVNALVSETLDLARDDLQQHKISLETNSQAPILIAIGDRAQLQQVLLNLIANAVDSMSVIEKQRVLRVNVSAQTDATIVVSVADTGKGVGAENLQRIFNPLFTTKPNGMGLGLSICRSIIQAHGGEIWVKPNQPSGAIFEFLLPENSVKEGVT
jgi:signal transduction histidine kinase